MKKHEASYAGYVYKKPVSYWSETEEVKKHLTKVSFNKKSKIEKGGIPIIGDDVLIGTGACVLGGLKLEIERLLQLVLL